MKIRDATKADVSQLVDLVQRFYDEAPYEAPSVDREQATYVMSELIDRIGGKIFFKVIDKDGKICGAILAERIPDLWSTAQKCVEHFIYVLPAYRGRPSAGKLMISFAEWSQEQPAVVRVEASSGLNDDMVGKVFERLNWSYRGTLYGTEAY